MHQTGSEAHPTGCTLGEADVRDELLAVVEGDQVLQRVRVHHQEAAVVQPHGQGLPVRGERTAAAPWGGGGREGGRERQRERETEK